MDRTILHCDCNSFFASVECLIRPDLKKVPMAVCGDPESRHGIILAKNDLAKKYGVVTAETIWQARQKCPQLVLAPTHFQKYRRYSRQINGIYRRFTDLVEPFSIDESWLDVTGSNALFGDGRQIADTIRETIRRETGLTVSVGVSFNKIFAKMGSDYKKPDATTVITRKNYQHILFPLPVSALIFCGRRMTEALAEYGIHTIGDLAGSRRDFLLQRLGKSGTILFDYANGLDNSPVRRFDECREVKSISNSVTFRRDLVGYDDIRRGVNAIADRVAGRMRKNQVKCRVVQIGIKNTSLHLITRQKTLRAPTHLAKDLSSAALDLIASCWNPSDPIRMLTVAGTSLVPDDAAGVQISFFTRRRGATREKQEKLEAALDAIREKYGHGSILSGSLLKNDLGVEGLHRK